MKCSVFTKRIIPLYETCDSIVAAADVTDFGADPTGLRDSTAAVRNAIAFAEQNGGGTVWMPAGQYLVTDTIHVPTLINLRGDYVDPDLGEGYGTVILAKPPVEDTEDKGLFYLEASSGVEGLTIYYPEQDLQEIKPYFYAFYLHPAKPRQMLRTLKSITLVNCYRGIAADDNEMTMLKNIKGTCLKMGIRLDNAWDVGIFSNIHLTPDYWANAAAPLKSADRQAIVSWSKANDGTGISIGSAEQQQYCNIKLRGFTYGIHFPVKPTHFMGSGPMYGLDIADCTYGIYAQEGTWTSGYALHYPLKTSIDWRCGYNISCSRIAGDKYAVYNASSSVFWPKDCCEWADGEEHRGYIRLTDCKLQGKTYGYVIYSKLGEHADLSNKKMILSRRCKTTSNAFEMLPCNADEQQIQAVLDQVGQRGGGVVYVPPGYYVIKNGLTVPANTELHGAAGCPQRVPTHGTVFCVYQPSCETPITDAQAAVTLEGDNAGISGIYFIYKENILSIDSKATYRFYPYTVRGRGKGVFCLNCAISGASHGVDFTDCDEHFLEHLVSCCTDRSIVVSGNDGLVQNCLQNGNLLFRTKILPTDEGGNAQKNFFRPIGRPRTKYITVGEGRGQQILNCFIYGGNQFLVSNGAQDLLVINACSDSTQEALFEFFGGSATVINSIRTGGSDWRNHGASIQIYNMMCLNPKKDRDIQE